MKSQKTLQWIRMLAMIGLLTVLVLCSAVSIGAEEQEAQQPSPIRYGQFFASVISGIDQGNATIDIQDLGITFQEIDSFVNAFAASYPEYSFFFDSYNYLHAPATGVVHSITFRFDGNSLTDEEMPAILNRKNWIDTQVQSIAEQIDPDWPDTYKLMWINDYICDRFSYEAETTEYHDVYNFLLYNEGVCQAYSGLFTLLAREAGFNVSFAISSDINHAWNLVELNGEWYVVDVTWNDQFTGRYDYFLRNGYDHYREVCGIYGVSWFEAFSIYEPEGDAFNSAFWYDSMFSSLAITDYGFYFLENGNLYRADLDTLNTTVTASVGNFKWKVPGYEAQYYADKFHDVVGFGTKIFYSTPKNVFLLDLSNGEQTEIYSNDHEFEIYGCFRNGNDLLVVHYDAVNDVEYITSVKDAFLPPKIYCNVAFKVGDKIVSEISVEKGTPIPMPEIPTLASDAYYDYEFIGWKNFTEGMPATDSAIVIEAEFEKHLRSYQLQYVDLTGSVIHTVSVPAGTRYGDVEPFVGSNAEMSDGFYLFKKWVGLSDHEQILSDVTVTGVYATVNKLDITNEDSLALYELYHAITSAILSGDLTIDVTEMGLNRNDVETLEKLYYRNNPYTAFAFHEIADSTCADGIDLVESITIAAEVDGIESKLELINTKIDMIVNEIDVDWTPLQKLLWINDYICDNFRYDATMEPAGLYNFLASGTGRDIDYVHLFSAIANKMGIRTSTVYSGTLKRYWSMAEMNGEWYNIDVATNDTYASRYKLFLLDDQTAGGILGKNRDLKIESSRVARDSKYAAAFWITNHYCSVMPAKDGAYTIYNGMISYVNLETLEIEAVRAVADYTWDDATSSSALKTKHYDLLVVGDLILYSTPNKVFVYSTVTKDHKTLYTSNKPEDIFSIHLEGNLLAMVHCADTTKDICAKATIVLDHFYKVTFVVDDVVYAMQTYYAGTALEAPKPPVKDGFRFVGWSVENGTAVESDLTVTAVYEAKREMATITFVSDGEVFKKVVVELGSTINLPKESPVKNPDEYYEYLFVAWDGYTEGMTADQATIVLVAKYKQVGRTYTVQFYDGNTLLLSSTYSAGTSFKNVAKPSVKDKTVGGVKFSFVGWGETPDKVLSDIKLTAVYEKEPSEYTITYYSGDQIIHQETVPEGSILKFISTVPTKESTSTHRYYFEKWVGATEGTAVNGDIVLNAAFMEVAIETEPESVPDTDPDTNPDTDAPTTQPGISGNGGDNNSRYEILAYCIVAVIALAVIAVVVVAISKIRRS